MNELYTREELDTLYEKAGEAVSQSMEDAVSLFLETLLPRLIATAKFEMNRADQLEIDLDEVREHQEYINGTA